MDADASASLADQVRSAIADDAPLSIVGGGSKTFLGRPTQARPLHVGGHRGIVSYEPSELVVTARGGTPLREVEAALGERGQMLAFEPPRFGDTDTLGGTVAAAQSGPRRPWAGAVRDFVLGVRLLDGKGEILSFGGQVMKNVAGYDLSRLMAGAMGTLGSTARSVPEGPAASGTRSDSALRARCCPGDREDERVGAAPAAALGSLPRGGAA